MEWIDNLGARYQYRSVPYTEVSSAGELRCLLCKTGWMKRTARVRHFHGRRHALNYAKVRKLEIDHARKDKQFRRAKLANTLDSRIQGLGLDKWRWHVKSILCDEIVQGEEVRGNRYFQAVRQLEKYEIMERASLLELALRKSHRGHNALPKSGTEKVPDREDRGSTNSLGEAVINGSTVIIPLVLAFLKPNRDAE